MDRAAISIKLKEVITDLVDLDEGPLAETARFEQDLGMDDLCVTELRLAVDDEFKITLPDEVLDVTTVGGLIDLIVNETK